ncbi:c-type cytochrome [Sulfitobacter sp. LCG007]
MSKFPDRILSTALAICLAGPALTAGPGLGRPATPDEITAWDLDVSPDGSGLPAGSGDVMTGETLFSERCAACHGEFAEGIGNWPELAGGLGTLADKDPVKTVGSYWPYLSTTWDYVQRSMPFGAAQTLAPDEVYALVAYILYSNDLVDEDFVLSDETFLDVTMPNANGFIPDDRDSVEVPLFTGEPCMTDCKESVEITMRAMVLDVTPEGSDAREVASDEGAGGAEPFPDTSQPSAEVALHDPELVAAGEKVFRKCASCHQVGEGAKNRTGPHLNAIMGRTAGTVEGFRYSGAMAEAGEGGLVWSEETLAEFLADPRAVVKRTRMSFAGLKSAEDIAAINAYLSTLGE